MRISHKHKFVFIAPPKTASSSVRKSLNPFSDIRSCGDVSSSLYYHVKPEKLKKYFEDKNWNWDEYYKFAFVRNPWSRCVSKWEYRRRVAFGETNSSNQVKLAITSRNLINKCGTFEGMIRQNNAGEPQHHWLFDDTGRKSVNFIGKLENLQEDFNTICDKIGIPHQQLPHKNATKHKHYTEYYDEETKQIVEEKYAKDIEYFGYEFGG
jgi:hypothetical protein